MKTCLHLSRITYFFIRNGNLENWKEYDLALLRLERNKIGKLIVSKDNFIGEIKEKKNIDYSTSNFKIILANKPTIFRF